MSNDNTLVNKVSPLIQTQLPEFIQSDHPLFASFLKSYYQFLESAEVTFSEVNNYLVQETTSPQFILDQQGDNVVLEDSVAKFTVGETITGLTSGATAKVLVDDVDNNKRLFISAQSQFIIGETVNGSTSNSSGTISNYKANPVQNIQQLLGYANVDTTVYDFLDRFRDSFLDGMVDNINSGVDKRKLIKNIRDLYISKGTKKGHELFFRLLLNEEATISYPTENLLRPSDGQWTFRTIMKVQELTGFVSELIGQTITGQSSTATAIPTSTLGYRESNTSIQEIEIDTNLIVGTFSVGETIKGTSVINDTDVSFKILGMVTGATVSNRGLYYTAGQSVPIATGGSATATATVETVGVGGVDNIIIDTVGRNYATGDTINFNNTGTDGTGAAAQISVVGGALAPETGDVNEYGMALTDHILLEDFTQSVMGDTYHGTKIVLEDATFGNAPGSSVNERGSITDIRLINSGTGYKSLPFISSISTASGTGAKLLGKSTSGIGQIEGITFSNFGFNYTSAPTISPLRHVIITGITGTFSAGDSLTSHTGKVVTFDTVRQLMTIDTTANLAVGNTIATSGASGVIADVNIGVAAATIGQVGTTTGAFLGEFGKASSDVMRIQDSNYYQDYSYVVKVGEGIASWRSAIKKTVHPAGWAVFGEVATVNKVSAGVQVQQVESFTPELASLFSTIFTTIFGRRLGVAGTTTLRANAKLGSNAILNSGERDVTLTEINTIFVGTARVAKYTGPTLDLLPKYAFSIGPRTTENTLAHYPTIVSKAKSDTNDFAYFNIGQFADVKINQVSDSNGNIPASAFVTRSNVPPPGSIEISNTSSKFDTTNISFDSNLKTFDAQ